MIDFPYFRHYAIKLIFPNKVVIDERFVDKIANLLIVNLKLTVVNQGKYEFTNNGLTKFWVLSQSHLVIHTWPEIGALHVDLMTCNPSILTSKIIENCLSSLPIQNIIVAELKY